MRRYRATGSLASGKIGGHRQLILETPHDWLMGRVAERSSITVRFEGNAVRRYLTNSGSERLGNTQRIWEGSDPAQELHDEDPGNRDAHDPKNDVTHGRALSC